MNFEYIFIFYFFILTIFISFFLFSLSYFIIFQELDFEKTSPYECGFQPFLNSRNKFNVKFYLIAILFIIFDLEIMFLLPWALYAYNLSFFSFWIILIFLFILIIGFFYEWKKGALEWD